MSIGIGQTVYDREPGCLIGKVIGDHGNDELVIADDELAEPLIMKRSELREDE